MTEPAGKSWWWILLLMAAAGCAPVGPDYHAPEPEAPPAWHAAFDQGLEGGSVQELADWWTSLDDPLLTELMAEAVKGNLDLKEAMARVREARALAAKARGRFFPSLAADASATKSRSGLSLRSGEVENYEAGLDASWELDIFGSARRAVEAGEAVVDASEAGLRDVLVTLTAEVALAYVEVRTFQARLDAARENLAAAQALYEYDLARFNAGIGDRLAVTRSQADLEQSRGEIAELRRGTSVTMNRLAVLLGVAPGSLEERLAQPRPLPGVPVRLTVGIPAQVLSRRPDVRRAERELAAETARIGVAEAERFPRLTLVGSIGLESLALENLPEWASRTFLVGPSVDWKIFQGGALRREVEAQEARRDQAAARYRKTVLAALEEVENALVGFVRSKERAENLAQAVAAAEETFRLAQVRYKAGLVDASLVHDTRRTLARLKDDAAQAKSAVVAAVVRLYKAMGGGWESLGTAG